MPPTPLVDERVQLEMNLIQPRREVDRQTIAEASRLNSPEEAVGQPEIK